MSLKSKINTALTVASLSLVSNFAFAPETSSATAVARPAPAQKDPNLPLKVAYLAAAWTLETRALYRLVQATRRNNRIKQATSDHSFTP